MTNDTLIETLPSPSSLKGELPITQKQINFIKDSREQIKKILRGEDPRLLIILGPCSIHDTAAAIDYAKNLQTLSARFSDTFYFIMRTYFEKPRTALGWKGMIYDPHLDGSNDITEGLRKTRALLVQLADMNIPTATEFLDPMTPQFIGDLISWACIGARTTESQIHRQIASSLPMPISFKNNTSGNVNAAINGILSAACPQAFFGVDDNGHIAIKRSQGNPDCHITLRGGEGKPNYDKKSIQNTIEQLKAHGLRPEIIIDCSHDNSCRKYEAQSQVFKSVVEQYAEGNHAIRGLILESHLNPGSQQFTSESKTLKYAVSITDACLDWSTTESLVVMAAKRIKGLVS